LWQALVDGVKEILKFLYELTVTMGIPSYGLAILFLTILIKLLLYPLSQKQMKSMKRMQEIQPKIKEIQEKYKKNPEKANRAIMELYQQHKINPLAGCLPLLIQMPVLIALFQALQQFQYADLGSSFFWIPHLKNPDPYFIVPVLVGCATYLQSKLSMAKSDQDNPQLAATKPMMLYFMPIFIGFMSVKFPAGLGLYWIFFSVLGLLQQVLVNRQPALEEGEVGGSK
jgi:YidC/Oxa1 family membrane protein insertase